MSSSIVECELYTADMQCLGHFRSSDVSDEVVQVGYGVHEDVERLLLH